MIYSRCILLFSTSPGREKGSWREEEKKEKKLRERFSFPSALFVSFCMVCSSDDCISHET